MTTEEEHLYVRYFYNSIIEFIYFSILYIESYGATDLNKICKHVKFFKVEVATLILSFAGNTFEDKLCQMLNYFDCFIFFNYKISLSKNNSFKYLVLEDLILSKCVDLVLRGVNNIDTICENLNFNNVIFINKKCILDILGRSSHFSVKDQQTVNLEHIHGLIGYEEYLSNSIITYFYSILYREKMLSFDEVRSHCEVLSFCGVHNMIIIFSIFHCCNQFNCQDGYVTLKKKSKKHPKSKQICLEQLEARFLSKSVSVGQLVYSSYGSFLHKWSGEIGSLSMNSGTIYCVVDFTNGSHGIFNIFFTEASLRIVSEVGSLKKYLKIRDVVEFDAKYIGKSLDRCWRATRLRLLRRKNFEYDENLYSKLCSVSELLRKDCGGNKCNKLIQNFSNGNFIHNHSAKAKSMKNHRKEKLLPTVKNENELYSMNNSLSEINEKDFRNKSIILNHMPSNKFYLSFTNLLRLNYSFMFGFIYMLMSDKGVAIAKEGCKFYNILFMKNSIYKPNDSEILERGQKVLFFVPFYEVLESFCISTFVYALNAQEMDEAEINQISPAEFAVKRFGNKEAKTLKCKFCNNFNIFNKFGMTEEGTFESDLKQRMQLIELYSYISSTYNIPSENKTIKNCLKQFLSDVCKINSSENCHKKVLHFMTKLSKYFSKLHAQKCRRKHRKSIYKIVNCINNFNFHISVNLNQSCPNISTESLVCKSVPSDYLDSKSISPNYFVRNDTPLNCQLQKSTSLNYLIPNNAPLNYLVRKSTSLNHLLPNNISPNSLSSLNSFKTCCTDSTENYYSCESDCTHSPNLSLNEEDLEATLAGDLPDETETNITFDEVKSPEAISDENHFILSPEFNEGAKMKQAHSLKNRLKYINKSKYLSLKSVPVFKPSIKNKRTVLLPSSNPVCKNCFTSAISLPACISLVSDSFYFCSVNIHGFDVTLPLPKQVIPQDIQKNFTLNSYCDVTVIPNNLTNLSRIITVNILV